MWHSVHLCVYVTCMYVCMPVCCNLMISWVQFAVDILIIQETQSCIRQGYVLRVGLFTVM